MNVGCVSSECFDHGFYYLQWMAYIDRNARAHTHTHIHTNTPVHTNSWWLIRAVVSCVITDSGMSCCLSDVKPFLESMRSYWRLGHYRNKLHLNVNTHTYTLYAVFHREMFLSQCRDIIYNPETVTTPTPVLQHVYAHALETVPQHNDVMKWKHFPRNWPFVREFIGHRWMPLTKDSDAELWCFLWSAPE